MVASYSCVVGCKDEFYMSIPSSDLTYRQVNVYFCTLASEFEAEDAVVTLGLFGSLPRRAWLAPTSQAAEGQAGRMQGVHVWLLGCA